MIYIQDMEKEIKKAILIRKFEEKLFKLLSDKKINGTIHTCIGQEWTGIAISKFIKDEDTIFSNHRCHGHYISVTNDIDGLINEIFGNTSGVNGGVGGSQHISVNKRFYSNGIQGGMCPIGAGFALGNKINNKNNISIVFIGDGTLGEGIVYETFNIASCWNIPVLFVIENNKYAQSTPNIYTLSGSIEKRAESFNIKYFKTSTYTNPNDLFNTCEKSINYCRDKNCPVILEIDTYRLVPHSKGDDFRDSEEKNKYSDLDITNLYCKDNNNLHIIEECDKIINNAIEKAEHNDKSKYIPKFKSENKEVVWNMCLYDTNRERHNELIYKSFVENFGKNDNLIMLGEDIKHPYGGAFKTTKNLSQLFPSRVINTPISESAILGIANGLALNNKIPIVEIMFGDFISLIFDQLINHATKFSDMYNCSIPVIIRTPMGGKRGYGPTHSQSIEKFFLGMYGLTVLSLNNRFSPKNIYDKLFVTIDSPTLVIENKTLYTLALNKRDINDFNIYISDETYPSIKISPKNKTPNLTISCYGEMLEEVEHSIEILKENNIWCEVICTTKLHPLNINPIYNSVKNTKNLVTIEEGSCICGFGSEVVRRLLNLKTPIDNYISIGYDGIIPSCLQQENELIPNKNSIIISIMENLCFQK